MKIDDTLDVWPLQGIPGLVGTFCVSFFSKPDSINGSPGLVYGGSINFMLVQLAGMGSTILLSGIGTFIVVFIIRRTVGLDVSADDEEKGLDMTQIGEQAYDLVLPPLLDFGADTLLLKLNEACGDGDLKRVKQLINDGADPHAHDYDGRTPAHLASAEGHLDVLSYLIKTHHINVNAQDKFGNTVLADAVHHKKQSVVAYLRNYGEAVVMQGKGYLNDFDIHYAVARLL